MVKPRPTQLFAVQRSRLHIFIIMGSAISHDLEHIATSEVDLHIRKDRTADIVSRRSWCHRIKSHHAKHHKGRHASPVLITWNSHQVVTEPLVKQDTDAFLRLPGLSGIIIQIRDMQARFICHREHSDIAGMIRQKRVELPLGHS